MIKHLSPCLAGIAFFLSIWQALSLLVDLPLLPSPISVAQNIAEIFTESIMLHCAFSAARIFAGLLAAIAAGLPLGLLMGYFPRAGRILSPLAYLAYPVPKVALLPIIMLSLGVGEAAKVTLIFLIVVFQIIIAVRDSVRSVPEEMLFPLLSLGASFPVIVREVLLPASLPKLMTAVRVAMATAVSVLFFAETFGTRYGIGYFIMDAWLRVDYLEMYSGIAVLSLIGLLSFGALDLAEHLLCRWQERP